MTTLETIENARRARAWLEAALGRDDLEGHFLGVATSPAAGAAIGIPPEHMLRIWDWVGGRTSLWSAVGLSLAIAIGEVPFRELLAGAHALDEHFATARLGGNLPAIAGLLSVWYRDFGGAQTTGVFAYSHALRLLPAYLQQLWMESNGKRVTTAGEPVETDTGSVLWGGEGTNAQHAVFQLLHQGTTLVPVDLIGFATPTAGSAAQHDLLAANVFAQAEALAFGRTEDELREAGAPEETIPHRVMPGNRPSSVILAERLDPATLGALLAFYEHSVFTQAAIWDIRPLRPVGRRARQGARSAHRARARSTTGSTSSCTTPRPTRSSGGIELCAMARSSRDVIELHEADGAFRRLEEWLRERGFFAAGGEGLAAELYLGYGLSESLRRRSIAASRGAVPAAARGLPARGVTPRCAQAASGSATGSRRGARRSTRPRSSRCGTRSRAATSTR